MHHTRCQLGKLNVWLMGFTEYIGDDEESASMAEKAMVLHKMRDAAQPVTKPK
jgi:hypothetical protein